MRGSLEAGRQQFNIETDAEHVRAWVVNDSGQRVAGAVFETDRPGDGCVVVGTWDSGDPVGLAAFSDADAAVFLNQGNWAAGLWKVHVRADTPEQAITMSVQEVRARFQPPRLAVADMPVSGEEAPWGQAG